MIGAGIIIVFFPAIGKTSSLIEIICFSYFDFNLFLMILNLHAVYMLNQN